MAETQLGKLTNANDMLALWNHQVSLSRHASLGDGKFMPADRGIA
jgi:hypothetical protein